MNSSMANHLLVLVLFLSCLINCSYSYQFVLGWVAKPSENYTQWAGRMRFSVNDTIQFKYKGGADSVAVVSKDDYDKCDAANPIVRFDDGDSIFKFDRSGPFYFITANKANCDQGQKLIVVVLAVRTPPSPPSPGINDHPPTAAPPLGSSPASSPGGGAISPGPATSLPPSPSSGATPPGSISPSAGPGGASSGSPSSATPGSPDSSTPGAGAGAPGSSTPGSGTPADVISPPAGARSTAAPPYSTCVYLISAASLVVSVGLGAFV